VQEKRKSTYRFNSIERTTCRWNPYTQGLVTLTCIYEDYVCWSVNAQKILTQNERSQSALLDMDEDAIFYGVTCRAKRGYKNLPDRWQDKKIAAWYYRNSWKHYSRRKHQWIPK
jgi:hypothetical protein